MEFIYKNVYCIYLGNEEYTGVGGGGGGWLLIFFINLLRTGLVILKVE